MLRDVTERCVGAARGEVVPFPIPAPLRDIEKAWIHTCQQAAGLRKLSSISFDPDTVENRVMRAVERCGASGSIGAAAMGVIVMHGRKGERPNFRCEIASRLWTDAMKTLGEDADIIRMLEP